MRRDLTYHIQDRFAYSLVAWNASQEHLVYRIWLWFSDRVFKYHYAPTLWLRLNNWFYHRYFEPYIYKGDR